MKILHIWNVGAISSVLAKYQRKWGYDAKVIHRESFQKLFEYPTDIIIPGSAKRFYLASLFHARKSDICHVHSADKAVLFLRKLYPRKKIVLTYHGTDIRNRWKERKSYWSHANVVTVSTIDLLPDKDGVIYTPNIIDLEHFQRSQSSIPNSALFLWSNDSQLAMDIVKAEAQRKELALVIQKHGHTRFRYAMYPRFLELFSHYFDVKECFGKINPAMSLTGLQALALGTEVFYLGKWLLKLPQENTPDIVISQWKDIYENL